MLDLHEQQSFKKFGTQLKEGGVLVTTPTELHLHYKTDITAIPVPWDSLPTSSATYRGILIGALLAARKAIVDPEHFLKSLEEKFASKSDEIRELNAKAFKIGADIGKDYAE